MDFKLIGSPYVEHGPYSFYKALKYSKNGKTNILALSEFFFVKLWPDSDFISIGELQLLWSDKNSEQTLASLRLYILPENTPDGRMDIHGEHEVLAITEKVVIRVEDLLTWITHATDWNWGLGAVWDKDCLQAEPAPYNQIRIDMEDVNKEKQSLGDKHWETQTGVVVLSYPKYCRYRGIARRLEGVTDKWLKTALVVALGGFTAPWKNTKVLFCKDTFDYPELEGHELLCNHLAPKLKGRPRKRKRATASPEESESESESSQSTSSSNSKTKSVPPPTKINLVKPRLRCTALAITNRPSRGPGSDERNFMGLLHNFMKKRNTPINKIPVVGFKEVNLYKLHRKVRELGGYDVVTAGRLWKVVYEVMGGDLACTSAATLSRRHYEKLLLPYERHLAQIKASKPPLKPTLSLPPVPLPQDRVKHVVRSTSKPQSGRSARLLVKQEKAEKEKENIPSPNSSRRTASKPSPPKSPPPKSQPSPTLASKSQPLSPKSTTRDAGTDDSPEKTDENAQNRPSSSSDKTARNQPAQGPVVKKQKLDFLREGGLEVTPVGNSNGAAATNGSPVPPTVRQQPPALIRQPVPQQVRQPSQIKHHTQPLLKQHAQPPVKHTQPQVKHTQPQVKHTPPQARQPQPTSRQPQVRQPQPIVRQSSIPRQSQQLLRQPALVKLPPTPSNGKTADGKFKNGSDQVSITVTPDMSHLLCPPGPSRRIVYTNPKEMVVNSNNQVHQPQNKKPNLSEVLDLRMKPRINIGSNLEITLVPPKPKTAAPVPAAVPIPLVVKKKAAQQQQPIKTSSNSSLKYDPSVFHQPYPGSYKPFVPVIDPLFYSGLYNATGLPNPFPASQAAVAHQQRVTQDQLGQFYKEILKHQFPSLLRDGSTSITLVGQTPTSNSSAFGNCGIWGESSLGGIFRGNQVLVASSGLPNGVPHRVSSLGYIRERELATCGKRLDGFNVLTRDVNIEIAPE
ncbi:AT rich interactive domain 5B (MRF1-like) [Nesidiocoris tenuis]|uniref:AT rich interactive domain 5B (MRF1-like) n=1 Tax=Nesidiocoris tenuis TaxID=355587 RepID=A0ABN7B4F1_9HEMI|nr:AT rich interactive domain 5B (MRF1-like) [Nesidiocoris tenuis]